MKKTDRALQEVWNWKDAIYKDIKDKSTHGIAKTIRKEAGDIKKKNLRSKKLHSSVSRQK